MAIPIPPQNGNPVTYRSFAFSDEVKRVWGAQWTVPDIVYEFNGGAKKESTDMTAHGIYRRA